MKYVHVGRRIMDIIEDVVATRPHLHEKLIDDVGMDSLDFSRFVSDVEREFGVSFESENTKAIFKNTTTVGDLIEWSRNIINKQNKNSMTLNEFCEMCHSTNTYSDGAIRSGVLIAGLAEECGEAHEEYMNLMFCDEDKQDKICEDAMMEVCDFLWYTVEQLRAFGYLPVELIKRLYPELSINGNTEMSKIGLSISSKNPEYERCRDSLGYAFSCMSKATSRVVGQYKRMWRDDGGSWSKSRVDKSVDGLAECFSIASMTISSLGFSLGYASEQLINKLASRQIRNCINGSGSHR